MTAKTPMRISRDNGRIGGFANGLGSRHWGVATPPQAFNYVHIFETTKRPAPWRRHGLRSGAGHTNGGPSVTIVENAATCDRCGKLLPDRDGEIDFVVHGAVYTGHACGFCASKLKDEVVSMLPHLERRR